MLERAISHETTAKPKYSDYVDLVRHYEDDTRTFHSVELDEESFNYYVNRPDSLIVDNMLIAGNISDTEHMVSSERCKELVSQYTDRKTQNNTYISFVPAEAVIKVSGLIKGRNISANIFASYDGTLDENDDLSRMAKENGVTIHELFNGKTNTSAGLNLFELTLDNEPADSKKSLVEVTEALDTKDITMGDGVVHLRVGGDFTDDDKAQLWNLFSQRFGDISDNMPFKLEESEEATNELLDDGRNVFAFKRNADGIIEACMFVTDQKDAYPWISPDFIKTDDDSVDMFIPGIAAYKKGSSRSSFEIIIAVAELVKLTGERRINMRFECTDVSSLYVPRITLSALDASKTFNDVSIAQTGHKSYLLLEI